MDRVKSVNRVFFATVLLSFVGSIINSYILHYTNNYFYAVLFSQFILIIPSLVYLANNHLNVAKAIRFQKVKFSNIILIIIFTYLITPLMNLINAFSMIYVKNDTANVMSSIVSQNGLLLSLFIVALIPCIMEEAVYRGIFFNEYRKVSVIKGIFLSGFLFGIIHGNLNQFSYAFVMGIVFALLIEATGSILSTMIVHFFINGTSITLLAVYPKLFKLLESLYGKEQFDATALMESMNTQIGEAMNFSDVLKTYGFTAFVATILAIVVFRAIAKNCGRWEHVIGIFTGKESNIDRVDRPEVIEPEDLSYGLKEADRKKRIMTVSLALGIICSIALMIYSEYVSRQVSEQEVSGLLTLIRVFLRQ
jgi:membrane protease YdiL (CAAX protease family)